MSAGAAGVSGFALLRLEGGPDEIGLAHGRAATDLVARNLDLYFRRFVDEAELPRTEVLDRAQRYWRVVSEQSPEFAAMVGGIALGAGQPLLDVVAMNLRFELLYSEFARIGQEDLGRLHSPAGECTAFAVLPQAAADGHLRIGQNWDWIPGVAGLLQHITRRDGVRILCFTEAGIAGGKIGMNSAGFGLAVNGLLSDRDDWTRLGRPFHLRTWEVLCSTSWPEAVDAVRRGTHSCSANFLIGRAGPPGEGTAMDLEAAPVGVCIHKPVAGRFAHANHFLDPGRLGIWQPLVEERRSTYHRCDRMDRLLADAQAGGPVGADTLRAVLRDHDEHPESICRHPNQALPAQERYQTVASIILDLHAGRMEAAAGPPCVHPYQEFQL